MSRKPGETPPDGMPAALARTIIFALFALAHPHEADAKIDPDAGTSRKSTATIINPDNSAMDQPFVICQHVAQKPGFAQLSPGISPETIRLKNILKMPWEELKEKLVNMSYSEIMQITDGLANLLTDSSKIRPIGNKLRLKVPLEPDNKSSFLELARKYDIPGTEELQAVLDKEEWTEQDQKTALTAVDSIFKWLEKAAGRYVEIQTWLTSVMPLTSVFDSPEKLNNWMEKSINAIKKYKALEAAIQDYRASLNQPVQQKQ